jgi:outer membrane protein assembly factor BamA
VKQLDTRVLVGVGLPYNKSTVLPYIKQYFAGGSNDLRAFYARTIGPGSYKKDNSNTNILLDQSGEIKLIGNIEYRFPITYKLDGAVFLDAGNVWLINEDTSRVGGKFEFDRFYKEIAVGAGFGLRVNLDYVIIRLDAAIPLRRPYKESNKYWTFTSPYLWRDYILSFAIGYPF